MSEYSRPYANEHLASLGVGKENLQNRTTKHLASKYIYSFDWGFLINVQMESDISNDERAASDARITQL